MSVHSSQGFTTTTGSSANLLFTTYSAQSGLASTIVQTLYTTPVLPVGWWSFAINTAVFATSGNTITYLVLSAQDGTGGAGNEYLLDLTNNDISINFPISTILYSNGTTPIVFSVTAGTSAGTWGYTDGNVRAVRIA